MLNKLENIVNAFFGQGRYGHHHKNGWIFLGAAYTTCYFNPLLSFPVYMLAGYSFIQAMKYIGKPLD